METARPWHSLLQSSVVLKLGKPSPERPKKEWSVWPCLTVDKIGRFFAGVFSADVLDINYQFDHSRICLDQCLPQLDISGQVWGQSHPLVCQHCLWTSSSRQSNAKRLRFSSCVWPALARVDFWRIDLRSPRSNPGRFRASGTLCLWWSTGLLGRTLGSTTAGASLWAPICCFQGCKDGNFVCTDHIISHYI